MTFTSTFNTDFQPPPLPRWQSPRPPPSKVKSWICHCISSFQKKFWSHKRRNNWSESFISSPLIPLCILRKSYLILFPEIRPYIPGNYRQCWRRSQSVSRSRRPQYSGVSRALDLGFSCSDPGSGGTGCRWSCRLEYYKSTKNSIGAFFW